jgi:hypothetical protein
MPRHAVALLMAHALLAAPLAAGAQPTARPYHVGWLHWTVVYGALACALLFHLRTYWYRMKRMRTYERYCRMRGFTFEFTKRLDFAGLRPAPRFGQAETEERFAATVLRVRVLHWPEKVGRHCAITGEWNGVLFTAFEFAYQYVRGDPPAVSVMVWELPPARTLPNFILTPKGLRQRLTHHYLDQQVGLRDVDFGDDPAFAQAYRLRGDDERGIRALFTPTLRQSLTSHQGQRVSCGGRHLSWWVEEWLPEAEGLDRFFEQGDLIRRVFWE